MGPKKSTASKKQKTTTTSSRASSPYDASRFIGADQQARYRDLEKRKIWSEKEFQIKEHGEYRDIAQLIEARQWDKLIDPPKHLNYDVVREFYANALSSDEEPFSFTTMVRGRNIRFDRNAINAYLGNPINLQGDELCAYAQHVNRGNWNIEEISRSILVEGRNFQLNASGVPIRALRDDMKIQAQVILLLILHNIRPRSHTSTATLDTTYLLYYIIEGMEVDIARVIANEMKLIAESGIKPGAKPSCPLAFPGLIMGLCREARMTIPPQVHETISGPINDGYITRFCTGKRNRRQAPPAPPAPQAPQHDAAPSHAFSAMDPRSQAWHYHTWDQNASNHRALNVIHDSMYRLQLQFGVPEAAAQQIMTPQAFQTHVAWPGDRPFFPEEASTAAAGDDDDDDDATESDNAEDDDDEEETQGQGGDEEYDDMSSD